MSTLAIKADPIAVDIKFSSDSLQVFLADGREITVPLEWFPRLRDTTTSKRKKWRLIGGGIGIYWEDIDEDISVENLLAIR